MSEEAGIDLRPEDLIALCDLPYDFGTGTVHSFAARFSGETKLSIDYNEIAEARWFSLEEAASLQMFPATASTLRLLATRQDLIRP